MVIPAEPLLDNCTECGACCFGDGARYVSVSGSDHRRLGEEVTTVAHFVGNGCYMRLVDGHCVALAINLTGPHFTCDVYSTRPTPCRSLEQGSHQCRAEQQRKRTRAQNA